MNERARNRLKTKFEVRMVRAVSQSILAAPDPTEARNALEKDLSALADQLIAGGLYSAGDIEEILQDVMAYFKGKVLQCTPILVNQVVKKLKAGNKLTC